MTLLRHHITTLRLRLDAPWPSQLRETRAEIMARWERMRIRVVRY